MVTEKEWGRSYPVGEFNGVCLCRIEVDPGGFCSWHLHRRKNNLFYCLRGQLVVLVGEVSASADPRVRQRQLLAPGQQFNVPAGTWHGFESDSGAEALELYWAGADPDDIVRLTGGGRRPGRCDVLDVADRGSAASAK